MNSQTKMGVNKITLSFKIVSLDEEKQKVWVIMSFCKCYFKVHFATLSKGSEKSTVSLCRSASFLSNIALKA